MCAKMWVSLEHEPGSKYEMADASHAISFFPIALPPGGYTYYTFA